MDSTLPLLGPSVDQQVLMPTLQYFDHLLNPEFDFPLLEHLPGYTDAGFPDELACQETSRYTQMIPKSLPFFSLGVGKHMFKREEHCRILIAPSRHPDQHTDMFDCLEHPPPPPTS